MLLQQPFCQNNSRETGYAGVADYDRLALDTQCLRDASGTLTWMQDGWRDILLT